MSKTLMLLNGKVKENPQSDFLDGKTIMERFYN